MGKLKSSPAAKIAAAVLLVIFVAAFAASLAGMVVMDSYGVYQTNQDKFLEERFAIECDHYSVMALAGYQEDFNRQELSQTNFRYGVIKADSIEDAELGNKKLYLARNFEELPDTDALNIYESDIGEDTDTWFTYGKNIWDPCYIMENHGMRYTDEEHLIEGWCYDKDTESFYAISNKKLYLLRNEEGYIETEEDVAPLEALGYQDFLEQEEELADGQTVAVYSLNDYLKKIMLYNGRGDQILIGLDKFRIVDSQGLVKLGEISGDDVEDFDRNTVYTRTVRERKTEHYIVVSFVQEPLQGKQSFGEGDRFVQSKILVNFVYRMRYPAIAIFVFSLAGMAAAFSFLMAAAGHHKGQDGICRGLPDRVPLDLYFACIVFVEIMLVGVVAISAERIRGWSLSSTSGFVTFGVIAACAATVGMLLAIAYCMSFAVNAKLGKWWRNTCIHWIIRKCAKALLVCVSLCAYVLKSLCRSVTLLWKVWIILAFLAFVEYVGLIALTPYYPEQELVFAWLLEKIILYPVIAIGLLQMDKLQKGAQRIANGELGYRIDTRHMFWEIKKHGEYLNDIGTGMDFAVNERLKSERFKTELITNVSHDIKTPLTSIINYVDLLRKEQIENPTVQEYLEVLHRQSARLKKLIEDLMEASKASTGSLSVVMEKCDAGVMLVQTVGEFEEKLMENQIELQIKKPQESILIEADNRHLWRVFDNLMNNICKYAQPMTRAYVNLDQDGHHAVITFRNISKYQLNISSEELMERFVRGDSSRNTEGSGLGISIARSLTELMGGTFDLVVDGDLFKVILSFPLYGLTGFYRSEKEEAPDVAVAERRKKPWVMGKAAARMQNAGAHAAGLGHGVADKTGRAFRRIGRFAYHVRQAAEQTKAEEAALEGMDALGETDTMAGMDAMAGTAGGDRVIVGTAAMDAMETVEQIKGTNARNGKGPVKGRTELDREDVMAGTAAMDAVAAMEQMKEMDVLDGMGAVKGTAEMKMEGKMEVVKEMEGMKEEAMREEMAAMEEMREEAMREEMAAMEEMRGEAMREEMAAMEEMREEAMREEMAARKEMEGLQVTEADYFVGGGAKLYERSKAAVRAVSRKGGGML